jgi:hypothetical protein
MPVRHFVQHPRVLDGGVTVGHLDVAPAFQAGRTS